MLSKEFDEKINKNYDDILRLNNKKQRTFESYYEMMKSADKKKLIRMLYDLSKGILLIDSIMNPIETEDQY